MWGFKGSYVYKNISYPKNTIQVLFLLVVASITQYKYLEKKELVEGQSHRGTLQDKDERVRLELSGQHLSPDKREKRSDENILSWGQLTGAF